MDIEEVKLYARIDECPDEEVRAFMQVAEEYTTEAGIKPNYNKARYKLLIKMLVKHFYDNRDSYAERAIYEKPFGISSLINQLQISGCNDETESKG